MPKANVTFEKLGLTVTVPAGTRLIEISEKIGAGITYGCREGECCTCTVRIVSGMEHMSERSVLEDKVLQENMAGRNDRLACQAQVLSGDIVVKAQRFFKSTSGARNAEHHADRCHAQTTRKPSL